MNNQPQPYQYQYQAPEEPLFSKTVFFSFIVAFVVLAVIGYGIFYFVNKKTEEAPQSMGEIEEEKAKKAKSTLSSGLKVEETEPKAEELLEPEVEEVLE